MTIKPLADRVLVAPTEAKKQTDSGLILTETEKPVTGTIISVGEGTTDDPMQLKVGDKVMYGRHAGVEIPVDTKVCLMMRQSDILATFE